MTIMRPLPKVRSHLAGVFGSTVQKRGLRITTSCRFPLSDFDQFWQVVPRVWENIEMANHPPMFPHQRIPPVEIPRLTGEQVILEALRPRARLEWATCTYLEGTDRLDFCIPAEHAEDLGRTFGLRSAVFPLVVKDPNEKVIHKSLVTCKGFRKDYLRNRIMHFNFQKFEPYSETVVWIPMKFWGLDDMIWQYQRWDKQGDADYYTHNSEIQMYWYGDEKVPGFLSIDIEQIRPPSKTLISLADIRLHECMKPVSDIERDHKIVEIFWAARTRRAEADLQKIKEGKK